MQSFANRIGLILTLIGLFFAAGCGQSGPPSPDLPTLTAEQALGKTVFTRHCASCHLLTPDDVKVGPSLYGIADRAGEQVKGQDAETYLLTSIMNPSDYLTEGFEDVMPKDLAKKLTGENIDAVVAYLLTLEAE